MSGRDHVCLNWSNTSAQGGFCASMPATLLYLDDHKPRRTRLLASLICIVFLYATSATAETWFAPNYRTRSADQTVHTPADFMQIFNDASWSSRPLPFQVFKIYAMFLKREPDAVLSAMISWLNRHHLRLAVEFGMLTPQECGTGVEGFDGSKSAAFIAARVSRLGGRIDIVAMDEPYWHSSRSPKPNACHWPLARTAENAASAAQVFRSTFPRIKIGDIEPVQDVTPPGLAPEFRLWADAFARATGHPLAFLHVDILWDRPWRTGAREAFAAMADKRIPVGAILSGDVGEASGTGWMHSLDERQHELQTQHTMTLSSLVFQSWSAYPDHIFPPSDPAAFSSVLSEAH